MKLGRYVIKARVLDEHEELPPGEPMPEGYEHISFRTIVWMMLVDLVKAVVRLPSTILFKLDRGFEELCNIIGRAGLPEIGGGLLQLRHPSRGVRWLPEGVSEVVLKRAKERGHTVHPRLLRPHFQISYLIRKRSDE